MKTNKEALATHLNMDTSDLTDYNYQPGRYTKSVYALSDGYYCASKNGILPKAVRKDGITFKWIEIKDNFVNKYGYKIYVHAIYTNKAFLTNDNQ